MSQKLLNFKSHWLKISITKKLFTLTVMMVIILWYPMDYLQSQQLQKIFFSETKKELEQTAEDDRKLFDKKIQIHHNSAKLIISQNRFLNYLEKRSDPKLFPESSTSTTIQSHAGKLPHWLPKASIMRSFFTARYAILLDADGKIIEMYHHEAFRNSPETYFFEALKKTGLLLRKLSHSQSYLTKLNNFPFVFSTESVKVNGKTWYLMLASPIDEQFLIEVTKQQAHKTILALLEYGSDKVIVSSNEEHIPTGEYFSSFEDQFLQTGKSFFDYGASDLDLQLISVVSLKDAYYMTDLILEKGRQQRLLLTTMLVIAFLFVGYWFSRGIKKLSSHIKESAQRLIGHTQNKNIQKMAIGGDELIALNYQFNNLADELVKKSTIQKKSVQALIKARDEAESANLAKSRFLSSMSHELRTPLNAILGFAQLFEMDPQLNEQQKGHIHEINTAGKHLLSLINDVLDLAKIESEQIDLLIEDLSINKVIKECLIYIYIEPSAIKKNIKLTSCECSNIVRADATRLKQVILNILSNAIKYNRENGEIRITCNVENKNFCRISVSDTGLGISTEQEKLVFEPFQRLGKEFSNIKGTGIGLSIAKDLIEKMDGKIGMHSTEGKGSTFWIEIPLGEMTDGEKVPLNKLKI